MSKATTDVTSLFEEYCKTNLNNSDRPLLHTEGFSLFDSMTAVELMDTMMDPTAASSIDRSRDYDGDNKNNQIVVDENILLVGVSDLHQDLYWDNDDLDWQMVSAVMVQNLHNLEAYMTGCCLVESLYTCNYAHSVILQQMEFSIKNNSDDEVKDEHRVLYASMLLLLKVAQCFSNIVLTADMYEEEDFSPQLYNFTFADFVNVDEMDAAVDQAMRVSVNKSNDSNDFKQNCQCVLMTLFYMYQTFIKLVLPSVDSQEMIMTWVDELNSYITKAASQMEQMKKKSYCTKDILLDNKAFNFVANRKLHGNMPFRRPIKRSAVQMIECLCKIVTELQNVTSLMYKISTVDINVSNRFYRLKNIVQSIGRNSPNILTRSTIALNLFYNDLVLGQYELLEMVTGAMLQRGVPTSLVESSTGKMFAGRLCKPMYDSLKLQLLSSPRQRGCIDTLILKDWGVIQDEAKIVDYYFNEQQENDTVTPTNNNVSLCANWAVSETLCFMESYLCQGLHSDLFHEEAPFVLWYLDFLLSAQLNMLTFFRNLKQQQQLDVVIEKTTNEDSNITSANIKSNVKNNQYSKKKKGGGKKNKGSSLMTQQALESSAYPTAATPTNNLLLTHNNDFEDDIEYIHLTLKRTICRGVFRSLMVAKKQGLLPDQNKYEFTSPELIFKKRFEAFDDLPFPPKLSYNDYLQGSDVSAVSLNQVLFGAQECFKSARSLIDGLEKKLLELEDLGTNPVLFPIQQAEILELKKTIVGNNVFLMQLSTFDEKKEMRQSSAKLQFDFVHGHYFTLKLVSHPPNKIITK